MKKIYVLLPIFLFFLLSCHNHETVAELDELKAQAELEQQNQALVEKFIGMWNSRDIEGFDEILDPRFKVYIPSTTDEPMSLDAYKEWTIRLIQRFPDIHYEIRDIFAAGDQVCIWWVVHATLPGADADGPDAGKKVSGGAIEIYTVKDEKIIEERNEMDELGIQQQMGYKLVPADDTGD
jgi:predicted ester cyclase